MRRPPRKKDAPIISQRLIYRVLFSASIIVIGTLFVYVYALADEQGMSRREQTMVSRSLHPPYLASNISPRLADLHLLRLSRSRVCGAEPWAWVRFNAEPDARDDRVDVVLRPARAHLRAAPPERVPDGGARLSGLVHPPCAR